MKLIFSILFSLFTLALSAQYQNVQPIGKSNSLTEIQGGLKVKGAVVNNRFTDTAAANADPYAKKYPGSIITVGDDTWMRNSSATRWIKQSGGGTPNITNSGAGYRLVIANTGQIKTLLLGPGMLIDSTTTPGALIVKVDTTQISTRAYTNSKVVPVNPGTIYFENGPGSSQLDTIARQIDDTTFLFKSFGTDLPAAYVQRGDDSNKHLIRKWVKDSAVTAITTTGTTGAATFVAGVLNIPNYGAGYQGWNGYHNASSYLTSSLNPNVNSTAWIFQGTSPLTHNLPNRSTNVNRVIFLKNAGTATWTISRAGSDQLYTDAAVTTITIQPGQDRLAISDGSYWNIYDFGSRSVDIRPLNNLWTGSNQFANGVNIPSGAEWQIQGTGMFNLYNYDGIRFQGTQDYSNRPALGTDEAAFRFNINSKSIEWGYDDGGTDIWVEGVRAANGIRSDYGVLKLDNGSTALTEDVKFDGYPAGPGSGIDWEIDAGNRIEWFEDEFIFNGFTDSSHIRNAVGFQQNWTVANDGNYTISKKANIVELPNVSANRTVFFFQRSPAAVGLRVSVYVSNNTVFSWTTTGATVQGLNGSAITTLANQSWNEFVWAGTRWLKIN